MDTNRIFHIKSHQIQWVSFQNLMGTMGFVRSNPIKSKKNLIKISWWSWDLSDQFPSNPMSILSKTHGDHGICQISSHQILWVSYQNLMVTMGFVRSIPIKSNKNPIKVSWWPIGFARSNHIKSNGDLGNMSWGAWDLSDQVPSNPMGILSKSNG